MKVEIHRKQPIIWNLFTATTKSGKKFNISPTLDNYNQIKFVVENVENGEKSEAGRMISAIKNGVVSHQKSTWEETDRYAIHCDNQYTNEALFGIKQQAWLTLDESFSYALFLQSCEALRECGKNRLQNEVDSIQPEDMVTIKKVITGYGTAYSLSHPNISYEAGKTFEMKIKVAAKSIKFGVDPTDWDSSVSTAEMTYREFCEIADPIYNEWVEKTEKARIAREEKAKNIESGKVLYFTCESSPHSEDLNGQILNRPAPKGGSFMLEHRVSESVWKNLKEAGNGRYYDQETLEDFDMFTSSPGWRYSIGALKWAQENGFSVYLNDKILC